MSKELAAVNQLLSDDPSLGDKLDSSTFTLTEPKDILEDLKAQYQADFPPVNDCNYTIKNVPKTLEGFFIFCLIIGFFLVWKTAHFI